jgi:histidine phosphotransferase ChpT
MHGQVDLRILELLAARLCHELISPIGAIANGVELLGEDDPDFVRDATVLIGQSARKAGQRLQFYRFAYGSSASGEGHGADARELVNGLLEGGKVTCEWQDGSETLPAEWQKLACNMVVLAAESLPRGGTISIAAGPADARCLELSVAGEVINVTQEARAALALQAALADLTSRTVHGYFTARLAQALGVGLALAEPGPRQLTLAAAPSRHQP